jgi:four helix bundle protein
MQLTKIEEFDVWKKASAFWDAVNATMSRPGYVKDFKLRNQIKNAIDSILSNMSEGFEQPTDKAFANYLYRSKGSTAEACTRLGLAQKRGYITESERRQYEKQAAEIGRITTGLIKHLLKSNRRRRGLGVECDGELGMTNDQRPATSDQRPTTMSLFSLGCRARPSLTRS